MKGIESEIVKILISNGIKESIVNNISPKILTLFLDKNKQSISELEDGITNLIDKIGYNVSDSGFYIVKRINGNNIWINTESNDNKNQFKTSEIIDIFLQK